MTTYFDAHAHQQSLMRTQNYAAQPGLLNELEWRPAELGNVVYYGDEEEPFVFIAVAKISPHKLKVGPSGNYISDKYGSLKKAKYQMFLTRSLQVPFKNDFDQVYNLLKSLQNKAAITSNIKNLLSIEAGAKLICHGCTRDVFVPRPQEPPKTPPHRQPHEEDENSERESETDSADREPEPEIDDTTRHWNVPHEFQAELQSIMHAYQAVPFPVYYNDSLSDPIQIERDLSNAIVEVAFTVHHNHIPNSKMDSFQAHVIQIKILRKGVPSSSSVTEPHQGPMSMYKPLPFSPSETVLPKETNTRKRPAEDEPTMKKSSKKKKKVTLQIQVPQPSNADDKGEGTSGTKVSDIQVHENTDLT